MAWADAVPFKFLTYQLSTVGYWPTVALTGNGELGFDSGEGARETWLILPVVICLSQRLSHACLRISILIANLRMAH